MKIDARLVLYEPFTPTYRAWQRLLIECDRGRSKTTFRITPSLVNKIDVPPHCVHRILQYFGGSYYESGAYGSFHFRIPTNTFRIELYVDGSELRGETV